VGKERSENVRQGLEQGQSKPEGSVGDWPEEPIPPSIRRSRLAVWWLLLSRYKMLLLLLGGALGTYARYALGRWISSQPWAEGFPYGTLVINVSGSFILGFASVVILERLRPEYQYLYLLVGTGFCGGFTTFSTFEWETLKLVRDGSWWPALANVLASVLIGFAGVLLGVMLAGLLFPRQEG
jgi:CrcB protein